MKQIQRREYLARHVHNFWPYLTPYKVFNLILNFLEKKTKILSPRSLPPYLKIDPTPICQLSCLGCEQSNLAYKKKFKNSMQISLEGFRRIVDPLGKGLLGISLSNFGEPLLHGDIVSLISYAHKKNIAVSFPSNLSLKIEKTDIEALVLSGLDAIYVSLDGASSETYGKYRVGGDFSLVLKNVKAISEAKQKYGRNRPRLIWKFVVFDHNKLEVESVERTYRELGFDGFELVPDNQGLPSIESKRVHNKSLRDSQTGCMWLWHAMIIRWDGEVFPCCTREEFNIGNAIEGNVREIWRSAKYRGLRNGFRNSREMNTFCRKCMGYSSTKKAV